MGLSQGPEQRNGGLMVQGTAEALRGQEYGLQEEYKRSRTRKVVRDKLMADVNAILMSINSFLRGDRESCKFLKKEDYMISLFQIL